MNKGNSKATSWYIFALRLSDGKYFVSRSNDISFPKRIDRHYRGKASWFTEEHKVLEHKILEVKPYNPETRAVDFRVNEWTLAFARRYGTENVRGGGYTAHYPNWPRDLL